MPRFVQKLFKIFHIPFCWLNVAFAFSVHFIGVLPLAMIPGVPDIWLWRWTQFWLRWLFFFAGIQFRFEGLENIPQEGAFILVANHQSILDVGILNVASLRPFSFIAKKELLYVPLLGFDVLLMGHFFIDRQNSKVARQQMDRVRDRVRKGRPVAIFAEGTRSTGGKLGPFKTGAFRLAEDCNVPILPVAIVNSHELLPKRNIFPKTGTLIVRFGTIIPMGPFSELSHETRVSIERLLESRR